MNATCHGSLQHVVIFPLERSLIELNHSANLNQSYFTNRQDRYLHFSAQPKLAQYCFDFLRIISTFSYTLLPSPPSTSTPYTYQQDHYTLHWSDPQTHPHKIHHKAQTALSAFQLSQCTQGQKAVPIEAQVASSQYPVESDKVLIFPIIQAGQFNIREEEEALALLFRLLDSKMSKIANRTPPLLDLTSGYFGLYHPYQEHILASDVETRIVVAGPKVKYPSFLYIQSYDLSILLGKWVLWVIWNIRSYTRGLYPFRTTFYEGCRKSWPHLEFLRQRRRWKRCSIERMGERRLDLPREG